MYVEYDVCVCVRDVSHNDRAIVEANEKKKKKKERGKMYIFDNSYAMDIMPTVHVNVRAAIV